MLFNTSKYAIRAVIYLALEAKEKNKIGIKKISEDLNLPAPFLGKILQLLAKQKLLSSTKGPHGGFGVGKDPLEITLFDIVNIIEGTDIFEKCLISMRNCNDENIPCPMHNKYETIRKELLELFKIQTIGNLAEEIKKTGKIIII